jgi:spermidine synthase
VISEFKGSKGEASGNIFAFSTLGSITGVYVTTFYLIPFQGVDNSVLAFSLICLVLGFYAKRRISVAQLIFLFVILFAIFSMLLVSSQGINFIDSGEIIHEETSQYRTIQIVDYSNGVRSIKFKGGSRVQSAIDKDNKSRIVLDYLKYSSVPFLKDKSIEKTLIIGGGGFVSPRIFSDISESNITVVEVDRLMYELSQEYMYYSPEEYSRVETIIEDGRTFIERTNKTYDYILIDAFTVESVPPHMTTKEYYESIKSRLSEDGYLVVNLVGKDKFFRAEYKTINSVFEGYNEYWFSDGNQVLVFTRKNLSEKRVNIENKKYNFKNIYSKTNDTSRIYTEDVPIITDNKNPSEVFSSE